MTDFVIEGVAQIRIQCEIDVIVYLRLNWMACKILLIKVLRYKRYVNLNLRYDRVSFFLGFAPFILSGEFPVKDVLRAIVDEYLQYLCDTGRKAALESKFEIVLGTLVCSRYANVAGRLRHVHKPVGLAEDRGVIRSVPNVRIAHQGNFGRIS